MRRSLQAVAAAGLALLVVLAVGTYVAGEQTEVARLRTVDEQGVVHETKLWVVDHDGAAWVRVARPERHWFERLKRHPEVELVRRDGPPQRMRASPDPSEATKVALDAAFRAKYGWIDWWYGVVLRHAPIPVRLEPAPTS